MPRDNGVEELFTVATATNSTRRSTRKSAEPEFKSKSARFVSLLKSGKTVTEISKITGDGYAFIYGVAKRNGFADQAANRRATKTVTIDRANGVTIVQTATGSVKVFADGHIETAAFVISTDGKMTKVRRSRATATAK